MTNYWAFPTQTGKGECSAAPQGEAGGHKQGSEREPMSTSPSLSRVTAEAERTEWQEGVPGTLGQHQGPCAATAHDSQAGKVRGWAPPRRYTSLCRDGAIAPTQGSSGEGSSGRQHLSSAGHRGRGTQSSSTAHTQHGGALPKAAGGKGRQRGAGRTVRALQTSTADCRWVQEMKERCAGPWGRQRDTGGTQANTSEKELRRRRRGESLSTQP